MTVLVLIFRIMYAMKRGTIAYINVKGIKRKGVAR